METDGYGAEQESKAGRVRPPAAGYLTILPPQDLAGRGDEGGSAYNTPLV